MYYMGYILRSPESIESIQQDQEVWSRSRAHYKLTTAKVNKLLGKWKIALIQMDIILLASLFSQQWNIVILKVHGIYFLKWKKKFKEKIILSFFNRLRFGG